MIKFDVLKRWTGEVAFTAELDCDESAAPSLKLGLAVRWAVKNGANLARAKWTDNIVIHKTPLRIAGLRWPITILDAHMLQ